MKTRTVLVIGGGIGGLAAAVALANVGLGVTVAEQQSDLHASVYGVGIIQPVNALRALDVIGCARACLDSGYSTARRRGLRSTRTGEPGVPARRASARGRGTPASDDAGAFGPTGADRKRLARRRNDTIENARTSRARLPVRADRHAPFPVDLLADRIVVSLGVIDIASSEVDDIEEVLERIDRVAEIISIDSIAVATNGGFHAVPTATADREHAKLQAVEMVANYIWGNEL